MDTLNQQTTSDDGVNRMAQLMPESFFYLDSNDFSQNVSQAFGPDSATPQNLYRTTATVRVTGNLKVYAICKSTVLVQPNSDDATKVNLILKPFTQPINGLPIKYFIYRGLNKADFINGDVVKKAMNTDYLTSVWQDFNHFQTGDETDDSHGVSFESTFIGYNESRPDTDLLPPLFYKVANDTDEEGNETEVAEKAYDLPVINAGAHLGFANGDFGLDIVLDEGNYVVPNDPNPFQLTLGYARAQSYSLDVSGLSDADQQLMRENCTRFIDAAAYWGLHAEIGSLYLNGNKENKITTVDDVYGYVSKYHTKNKFYLYIQANRQRSYNFYGNYLSIDEQHNIKVNEDGETMVEKLFGIENWPIHIYENNSSIRFQLITHFNPKAILYCEIGTVISENNKNFMADSQILIGEAGGGNYSKEIQLSIDRFDNQSISSFARIIFNGNNLEAVLKNDEETFPYKLKDLDNTFDLIHLESLFNSNNSNNHSIVTKERKQIIEITDDQENRDFGIISTTMISDSIKTENEFVKRETLVTNLHALKSDNGALKRNSSSYIGSSKIGLLPFSPDQNNFYQPEFPYYYNWKVFSTSGKVVTGLELKTIDHSQPTKRILGLMDWEKDQLKSLVTSLGLSNPSVFFENILGSDSYSLSPEGINYKTYKLLVVGEIDDLSLEIFNTETSIIVYTIDDFVFYSGEYSKYTRNLNSNNSTSNQLIYGPWQKQA